MNIYLNGKLLPGYNSFKEVPTPNAPQNITLDGTLFVDFINRRRKWEIVWDYMKSVDYAIIRSLYDMQFSNSIFLVLSIPDLNIFVPVYATIGNRQMIWNNTYVQNFILTLDEQYAVS